MGQVVPGDDVAIGLGLDQLRPAEGPAAADFVVNGDVHAEDLLQRLFLEPGGDVRLAAGIETDVVGDPFVGETSRIGCADPDHGKGGKKGEKVSVTWVDTKGETRTDEATIA